MCMVLHIFILFFERNSTMYLMSASMFQYCVFGGGGGGGVGGAASDCYHRVILINTCLTTMRNHVGQRTQSVSSFTNPVG